MGAWILDHILPAAIPVLLAFVAWWHKFGTSVHDTSLGLQNLREDFEAHVSNYNGELKGIQTMKVDAASLSRSVSDFQERYTQDRDEILSAMDAARKGLDGVRDELYRRLLALRRR